MAISDFHVFAKLNLGRVLHAMVQVKKAVDENTRSVRKVSGLRLYLRAIYSSWIETSTVKPQESIG